MRSLYLKIALIVLVAFVLSFVIVRLGLPHLGPPRMKMRNGLGWVAAELERATPSERPALLARARNSFGVGLTLESRAALAKRASLPAAGPGMFTAPRGTFVFAPLDGGAQYLVAGPMPGAQPPREGARLVLLLSLFLWLSLLSALLIALPITRRLRRLQRATQALSRGNLDVRVDESSADVVGELAASFNAMAARLEDLFRQREQLLQAVSHEIGTPLARIRFHLEALEGTLLDRAGRERLRALDQEVTEIDQLSAELSSWIDADGREPSIGAVPLAEVVQTLVEQERALAGEAKTIDLSLEGDDALAVSADRRQLERALSNLIRNAARHARRAVVVSASREGSMIRLEVRDDGPGIPPSERRRVFEPFSRLDSSRSRRGGGMGLGLAITERILRGHGASVVIEEAFEGERPSSCAGPPAASRSTRLATDGVDDTLGGLVVLVDDLPKHVEHLRALVDHALELHRLDVDRG